MISFRSECQGLPHHLRIFMLGQAKPSPVVLLGVAEGAGRGQESCFGKKRGSHITFKSIH